MKQMLKKAIPALVVLAAAYVLILHPMMSRGTIKLTVRNDTSEPLTVTEVSGQAVGETIEPGGKLRVNYKIGDSPAVTAYFDSPLMSSGPQPFEVEGYVERAYYGSASVTVGWDSDTGKAVFEKSSNITL